MSEDIIQILQETVAHQDQQITDLNDIVIEQGKDIDVLKATLRKLHQKIEALESNSGADKSTLSPSEQAARDKPPHY